MSFQALTEQDAGAAGVAEPRAGARASGPPVEFHQWPLPGYVWSALESCYHSIYCSEPLLRVHDSIPTGIEALVLRRDGAIIALILFERVHGCAVVINEVFELDATHLQAVARALFAQYPTLTAVRLRAVALQGRAAGYRCLVVPFSDDYVIDLPSGVDEWLRSLSAQTREKIRYHWRRSQRRAPSLRLRIVRGDQIDSADVKKVIDFSRARMKAKGKRFGMDATAERHLCELMQERGQLSVIEIDGEVRAGLLCTLAGRDITMHVIAHDPAYDDLRLGFLCCAMTVQHAIEQGMRRFHFLWGQYDYKTRLGGRRIALCQVLLLRAPLFALLHPRRMAGQCLLALRSFAKQVRQRLFITHA